MEDQKKLFCDCYNLLKQVMLDGYHVQVLKMTPPYKDFNKIDQGMRAVIWNDHKEQKANILLSDFHRKYRLFVVKSNLGFCNVLAFFCTGERPDFISIGPFREDELSSNYFIRILKETHISPESLQRLKYIYESMPFVNVDRIVNVTRHILGVFVPAFKDITPELLEYAEEKREVQVDVGEIDETFIRAAVIYQQSLNVFLDAIKRGDNEAAKNALQAYLIESRVLGNSNLQDYRRVLLELNDYCLVTLLQTSIHPSHVVKQSLSNRARIESLTSLEKMERMPWEICRKYCLLMKNYANPEYSRLTKDVIAYIQFHLEEPLSLSELAEYFGRNASVLSHSFSKETGQTLTRFIQETRVRESIRLFNTTDMSVSEVAMAVGYHDFSYFSKIFSKQIGCSPREYKCRNLKKADFKQNQDNQSPGAKGGFH